MLRRIFAGAAIATVFLCGTAQAASATFGWTGFYVGGYAGYGWGKTEATDIGDLTGTPWVAPLGNKFSGHPDGFVGGGQVGVNFQVDAWVAGLEADYGALSLHGSGEDPLFFGAGTYVRTNASYAATYRLRFGYALDRTLLYLTGGAIDAEFNSDVARPLTAFYGTHTGSQWGWTIGGGVEYAFAPNWSVKAEYLYYDVGNERVFQNNLPDRSRFDIENTGNLVRVGLNYRFGN